MQRPSRSSLTTRLPHVFARLSLGTVLLALLVVAGALLVGFVRLAWTEHQINQSIARQEAINAAQRGTNDQLKGLADWSESDAAVEQAARDRLGMAREGETVLRPNLVLPPTPTVPPARPEGAAPAAPVVIVPEGTEQRRSATAANALGWWHAFFPRTDVQP